jgi:hypothetical protein
LILCDVLAKHPIEPASVAASDVEPTDGAGHRRPVYYALLSYAVTRGCQLANLPLPKLPAWPKPADSDGQPADRAEATCVELWRDLARLCHSRSTPTIDRLVAEPQPAGHFFAFDGGAGENPEPWWYHELIALHAVTTFAAITDRADAAAASRAAAMFHHNETQPDHATGQPWAVHAFLADPETLPTADLLLLPVTGPGSPRVIDRILLADAALHPMGDTLG